MEAAKHTPAPWVIPGANIFRVMALKDGKPYRVILADAAPEDVFFGRDNIGWPYGDSPGDFDEVGIEAAANARLISAAPDLLEACEGVVRRCEAAGYVGMDGQFLKVVKAAIAKATGV